MIAVMISSLVDDDDGRPVLIHGLEITMAPGSQIPDRRAAS
jgi:hypothetical protein